MITFTQSMQKWLFDYHPELIAPLMFGHIENFTNEHAKEYLSWCKTDEGRSYLKGGCNYVEGKDIEEWLV
jgi:hypothetical protein